MSSTPTPRFSRTRGRFRRAAAASLLAAVVVSSTASGAYPGPGLDPSDYPGLVWHAEALDGSWTASHRAERAVNPASVVKIATTLWVLREIGPDARFETRVLADGSIDADGVLHGDLVVVGGGDPDFHVENAFLVALRLIERGVRKVDGDLVVHPPFWIGWEGGAEKRLPDEGERARLMAVRMRSAMDSHRWPRSTQRAWRRFAADRGIDPSPAPRIEVTGDARAADREVGGRPLVVHRSKTAASVLRRFNIWSNNDIDRFEVGLGAADELVAALRSNWGEGADGIRFSTTSGLGENRMTPRQIVRLLRELVDEADAIDLSAEDVLPVAGCDPGTLRNFPALNAPPYAGSVTGKTGTLVYTDHGVAAFAGIARTHRGPVAFAAVYPRAGRRMHWARSIEQRFVVDLIDAAGGPVPGRCPLPPPGPDDDAAVFDADRDAVPVLSTR